MYDKPNFTPSDNQDDIFPYKPDQFDDDLKNMELRSIVFDEIIEDNLFVLD